MKNRSSILFGLAGAVGLAITAAAGCSSSDTHSMAPPLGAGGSGGTGGASSSSRGHSSSHASSSHASSTHASSSSSGAGGSGGTGGSNLPPHCSNTIQDQGETDVDCGGDCGPCEDNLGCMVAGDCKSLHCVGLKCAAANCDDGITNGGESDKDCGGPCSTKCADNAHCNIPADCDSKVCTNDKCTKASCTDHQQNGGETDVDCGGDCPTQCSPGQKCSTADDCTTGTCSGTCQCPAGMITAPRVNGTYCVDATEVTISQYNVFFNAHTDPLSQDAECLWNPNFSPAGDFPGLPQNAQEPIRFVNWCDAKAYCTYVGKHLCGGIQGGAIALADVDDASKDQWFNACSRQGSSNYPYDNAYNPAACNGDDSNVGPWQVSTNRCAGGLVGLWDMSGNVAEWEDACDGNVDDNDSCAIRGGSYTSDPGDLRCDSGGSPDLRLRDYTGRDVGFRCCL